MSHPKVEVLEQCRVYQGYFRIDRYRLRHRLYAGGQSAELLREVMERGHVGAVLPVDPWRDRVVLIEQFRPGAYAAGWEPWLTECVAGIVESGETAQQVAIREAAEEAHCDIDKIRLIRRFLTSPGACSETVHLYVARVNSEGLDGFAGLADEGEDIKVCSVSITEAIAMLDSGEIVNAKTIIALQWLAMHYDALKADWLD
jgi:ADP-ribose pyrophosphatase